MENGETDFFIKDIWQLSHFVGDAYETNISIFSVIGKTIRSPVNCKVIEWQYLMNSCVSWKTSSNYQEKLKKCFKVSSWTLQILSKLSISLHRHDPDIRTCEYEKQLWFSRLFNAIVSTAGIYNVPQSQKTLWSQSLAN